MAFIIGIAILFLLILMWVCIKFIALVFAKKCADSAFNCLYKNILLQYELILPLLSECGKFMFNEQSFIAETVNLINKSKEFTVKKDGSDRIIAYANTIFHNTCDIIRQSETYTENKQMFLEVLAKYQNSKKQFDGMVEHYNKKAKKLKHYVDVFPSSLIARFINIKTMNYIY